MAVDVESLLAPVSDDNPVGADLSYDTERQEIEAAFETSASGGASNEGDTDWRAVLKLIEQQSARTKDLLLAVLMMRAGARMAKLDVVERGAAYLAGLCETYWSTMHPTLEEYDFQGRKAPCESLTRIGDFLGPLKTIILIRHPRLGEYSSNDLERFARGGDSEDGYGMFRAALQETPEDDLAAIQVQIDDIKACLLRADRVMTENAGGETSVNFQPTYDVLTAIGRNLKAFLPGGAEPVAEVAVVGGHVAAATSAGLSPAPGGGAPGRIESREDVIRALDAITDYYRRKEPSSPVPLALTRARDWVTLDFMSVMEDIAPGSVDDLKRILVSSRNREESGEPGTW